MCLMCTRIFRRRSSTLVNWRQRRLQGRIAAKLFVFWVCACVYNASRLQAASPALTWMQEGSWIWVRRLHEALPKCCHKEPKKNHREVEEKMREGGCLCIIRCHRRCIRRMQTRWRRRQSPPRHTAASTGEEKRRGGDSHKKEVMHAAIQVRERGKN